MFEHRARILWVKPEDGGRRSPPTGPEYSTVARFESLADRWPEEAWSIVLRISASADASGTMLADIRMLVGANAPRDLLASGSRFDLFEGDRHVASGEVL